LPLDLSKLTDAVAKVASLASSVSSVAAERDAAVQDLVSAQADIDQLTATLLAATTTPAESAGIAAVAAALAVAPAPVDVPVAPAVDPVPSLPALGPVAAPVAQSGTTFLPGDPRANA
jgi:hypothetical protein